MTKAQLIHGEPFPAYLARTDRVHFSTLKRMATSALAYRHAIGSERRDTSALQNGRMVHALTLEGNGAADFAVCDLDRRTKEWKAFQAANSGKQFVKGADFDLCLAQAEAVKGDPIAGPLVIGCKPEVTCLFEREGVPIRCRFDGLRTGGFLELKTTRKISKRGFQGEVSAFQYHAQLGLYAAGYEAAFGHKPFVRLVAVENVAPFDVAVYAVPDDVLAIGLLACDRWLAMLRECEATNHWPGWARGEIQTLELPAYMVPADDVPELDWSA